MSSEQTAAVPDEVRRRLARQVADAALAAVDPAAAIQRQGSLIGHQLTVGVDRTYDLQLSLGLSRRQGASWSLARGRPAGAMAQAVEEVLVERIATGLVSIKDGYTAPTTRIELREAGPSRHPDVRGREAAQRMVGVLQHSR